MGFFYFLGRKKFYIHLLIAIVLSFVILWLVLLSLDLFTRHGKVYVVPDLHGKSLAYLTENNYENFFDFQVIDSVFDKTMEKGSIIIQNPLPGSKVKKGRHVYLTIVAEMPEKVAMPNLKNLSLRQALVTLEAQELLVGKLEYVEYFARNAVVDQVVNNEPIEPGTELRKGTTIDLIVGKGDMNASVALPMLIGMEKEEAIRELHYAYLNLGNEYYINVDDSTQARVFNTDPHPLTTNMLYLGQQVDIWYRSDLNFDFESYIKEFIPDTIGNDTLQLNTNYDYNEDF
ncbi:MAG: penicillin-binding protein [Marinilabiliales bacterium]|nr:MAG: penicillin-binding protein [Marinilabiliales bacterium]